MKSKLITTLGLFLLFICLYSLFSFNSKSYETIYPSESYITSTKDDVNSIIKEALKSPILKEIFKYQANIFISQLKMTKEQKKIQSRKIITYDKSTNYESLVGFKSSKDFHKYIELLKEFKDKFKIDEMSVDDKKDFFIKINMIQLEKILNDNRIAKELKTNKKLSEFVEKMMVEKNVNSKSLFTFNCQKCAYDYMACMTPVESNFTISGNSGEIWTVYVNGTPYTTEVFWVDPYIIYGISTTYTQDDCYLWYQYCLDECNSL